MNKVVVGIASNIDAHKNYKGALKLMSKEFNILKASLPIVTKALPAGSGAPDFLNGSVLIKGKFSQEELKSSLLKLEEKMHRVRTQDPNEPRTIDLDILVWNEEVVDEDVFERSFLKESILNLIPDFLFANKNL